MDLHTDYAAHDERLMRRTYDDKQEAHASYTKTFAADTHRAYEDRLATIQRREAHFLVMLARADNLPPHCPPAVAVAAQKAADQALEETQWDHERKGYSLDLRGILIDAARNLIFVARGYYKPLGKSGSAT
jgi:hypothetical protein